MARKDRAPTPPKRPQAPQRRSSPATRSDDDRRRRKLLYALAAAGLVALAIVLGVVLLAAGGKDKDIGAIMRAGGCELQARPGQSAEHSAEQNATDDPKWNSDPPTSGPHYQVPAVYGEYDSPLQIAQVVHNLEHGGMYILYGPDVPQTTVAQMRDFYGDDPRGLLLAPYTKLGDKIALGAWVVPDGAEEGAEGQGYLATCSAYDRNAFTTFRDEFRFTGPERFPPDSLQPGST